MPLQCEFALGLARAIQIYTLIMLVYALVSWIPDLRRYRWTNYLAMLVDPVLAPVRRIIPPVGGLDLSFLIVIIILNILPRFIVQTACLY